MRTGALSWREFQTLIGGLLACDCRLSRRLLRDTQDDQPTGEEGGDDQ